MRPVASEFLHPHAHLRVRGLQGSENKGKCRGGNNELPIEEWGKWRAVELAEEDVAVEKVVVEPV